MTATRPLSSLILMKWPTNVGYAIGALEKLFYEVALALAQGDAGRVHFTYTDASPGRPATLPAEFANYSTLDINHPTPSMLAALGDLVRKHQIDFAMPFDIQPIHPMNAVMRRAGVTTIIPYWGAPISGPSPPWKLALKRVQIALSRTKADGLIFESSAMADLAVNGRGVSSEMIDIVPLGVDVDRFKPDPESDHVHRMFNIPRERRVFVFTGHCTPRKGIKTLVEAAIEVLHRRGRQDAYFLMCGNTGDESRPYEEMYQHLDVAKWIRFAGYRRDVAQIFQSAYCGVIPSSGWDSFTLSSVEMAACGLPIIASNLQGLADAVLHQQTGLLFEAGNAQALADAIERLLDDDALARELGRSGRLRCESELTLDIQRRRLRAAIERRLPDR